MIALLSLKLEVNIFLNLLQIFEKLALFKGVHGTFNFSSDLFLDFLKLVQLIQSFLVDLIVDLSFSTSDFFF